MTKLERFARWFRTEGHWIYGTQDEALSMWLRRGIEGLPDLTEQEAVVVQDWRAQGAA